MDEQRNEYQEDLAIDKYHLENEWDEQALLFMKWAERHVEALHIRDSLKDKMDLVKAQIDMNIRSEPVKFGFDKKPTEAAISNCIIEDVEYQKISAEYLQAKKDVNILQAVKEAMEHKKKALEAETSLWIGGFYSNPKIPDIARRTAEDQVSEDVRKSLKRRSKI